VIYRSVSTGPDDEDDKELGPYLDGEWSKETDWGEPGPLKQIGKFWRQDSEETPPPSPPKEKTKEDVLFTDRDTTDSEFESAEEKRKEEPSKEKPEEVLFTDKDSEPKEEDSQEEEEESESQSETPPPTPRTRYKRKTQPRDDFGRFLSRKDQTGEGEEGEASGEEGEGSGEEEEDTLYTVENILDTQVRGGKIYHLVKWEGFDETHNSWMEASQLEDL
jgi:hypothetical protein